MLNISKTKISKYIPSSKFDSLAHVDNLNSGKALIKFLAWVLLFFIIFLFLPWTQNIRSKGKVTTLRPEQKPQKVNSAITSRIKHWNVKEGDFVNKGDTLLILDETKSEYLDPNLIGRTKEQVDAKIKSVELYGQKTNALNTQLLSLIENKKLKVEQAKNKILQSTLKIKTDSMDLIASKNNLDIAQLRYDRVNNLFEQGLKSKTDLESKNLSLQKAIASLTAKQNKLLTSRNDFINAKIGLNAVIGEYNQKIAKASSDKLGNQSATFQAEAQVSKLENTLSNYSIRNDLYVIRAPQDGYVTKIISSGIGEILKEGQNVLTIMPAVYDLAIETYVKPIDLPLINLGQEIRIQFDGWPAIVFSGWPDASYGTFSGKVFAIDNYISDNGKYRVLVTPDTASHEWPKALRVGSASNGIMLLNDVSIWYEMWRVVNSFPPDYYKNEEQAFSDEY